MALSSLLPLAGAAIAPVLGKVIDGVSEGLSFLDVLHKQEQVRETDAAHAAEPSTPQHDFVELADRLRERFAQFGIDLATPLRLKQNGRDRVVVDGDHPDRVLVESIFRDDKELTELFHEVADSAARGRAEADSGITKDFHFVLAATDALIEFA
jgi:hypothetical protein